MLTSHGSAPLLSLIYASAAVVPFSNAELVQLLEISRRNNSRHGVTGMLLYRDGNFMQALEGPEPTVLSLQERIRLDPRHEGYATLLERRVADRQFPEWTMGFQNLDDPRLRATPGYSEFLNVSLAPDQMLAGGSRAARLFEVFRREV